MRGQYIVKGFKCVGLVISLHAVIQSTNNIPGHDQKDHTEQSRTMLAGTAVRRGTCTSARGAACSLTVRLFVSFCLSTYCMFSRKKNSFLIPAKCFVLKYQV